MRASQARPVVLALLAALVLSGCGGTTFRVTGTPAEERAKTGAVNTVQGFWRAFTTGNGEVQCELATRRLAALRRAMGGTCAPTNLNVPSFGVDIYDIRIEGPDVLILAGAHGPYESHRYLFRTVREGADWKVDSIDLLPPRSQGIGR
jgi:hypothetical protein